jgi:hypothetical protein
MRIAFYVLSAILIVGMSIGLYYIISSKMKRHRGFQRAAVVDCVPALSARQS